jgi:5-methylcytosine-specific restriction endonuclease McrA
VTGGQARLSHAINAARLIAENLRGTELRPEVADAIKSKLAEAKSLLRGTTAPKQKPTIQTGTRRFKLWRLSPLCTWCGRVTRIEGVHEDDAATLDHLRRKGQRGRAGSVFPDSVLACRRCNHARGQPPGKASDVCPVILAERRRLTA